MAVDLSHPWFLLAAIPAAALLLLFRGKERYPAGSRKWILACRSLVMGLLILSLTQPQLVLRVKGRSLVYLLDRSQSVTEDYGLWIEESLKTMEPEDRVAMVGFGRDTALLKPYYMERLPSLTAAVDGDFSNLAAALAAGYSLLPGSGGRLVLFSDGLENIGDALQYGEMLALAGVAVDVVALPGPSSADVAVRDVILPKNTWPGQEIVVEVVVEASIATAAQLKLYWEGDLVWQQKLDISRGSQSYSLPLQVTGSGLQRLRATIETDGDSQSRNNAIDGLTFVQAPPRVLIVEGMAGKGMILKNTLASQGLVVDLVNGVAADLSPSSLAPYRGIILVDVPAYRLREEELNSLETFVRVMGGGLLAVGGKSSFGPGLYEGTPLEALLPVKMTVEGREEVPGMDLVLIVDRSSSMTGENLNMAKNAAIRSLSVLKDSDRVGVVTFDTVGRVEIPLTSLQDGDRIEEVIRDIGPGGGTAIYTGLKKGLGLLAGEGDRVKHIILLSDGQDGSEYNYQSLLAQAVEKGVTISTIALGEGADYRLMADLAELGKGRSYRVSTGRDLPEVFLQETVLAGGDWLVEESFVPSLVHPDTLSLAANTPTFHGYVAATAKPLAEVMLLTHRDHPLLSRWQYGLGRAVAFTSDTFGLWSADFLTHAGFASLWLDMLNWAAPTVPAGDLALESRIEGAGVEITALLSAPLEEGEQLLATLVDGEGKTRELQLLPLGSGRYGGTIEHLSQGVYLLSATRSGGGEVSYATGGFAIPYPAEYRVANYSGKDLLLALAKKTGGRVLSKPGEVFALAAAASRSQVDITWWLVLLALMFWPIDIVLRRLGGPRLPARKTKEAVQEPAPEDKDETLERLLAAKDRRR